MIPGNPLPSKPRYEILETAQVVFTSVMSCLFCFAAAYASLKLYDEPVRRWLTARWLHRKPANGK